MPVFAPLKMMIKGLTGGIRMLGWAAAMIFLMVYVCSVFLRQTVGAQHIVDRLDNPLFSSIDRTMFSVFRCFMGDCNLSDGTPMPIFLEDVYGLVFTMPFSLIIVIVVFGQFNVIVALFVQSVLDSAAQKSSLRKDDDRAHAWMLLRRLVMRFMFGNEDEIRADRTFFLEGCEMTRRRSNAAIEDPGVLSLLDALEINVPDKQ